MHLSIALYVNSVLGNVLRLSSLASEVPPEDGYLTLQVQTDCVLTGHESVSQTDDIASGNSSVRGSLRKDMRPHSIGTTGPRPRERNSPLRPATAPSDSTTLARGYIVSLVSRVPCSGEGDKDPRVTLWFISCASTNSRRANS